MSFQPWLLMLIAINVRAFLDDVLSQPGLLLLYDSVHFYITSMIFLLMEQDEQVSCMLKYDTGIPYVVYIYCNEEFNEETNNAKGLASAPVVYITFCRNSCSQYLRGPGSKPSPCSLSVSFWSIEQLCCFHIFDIPPLSHSSFRARL